MDRSHTMISMKDGALRLAVPTAEYTKMARDAEQEVAFEEAMCGQMPYSQRHSRIDTLLEFAVWKHIWNNHPKESPDHAPMLTRSWRHSDQSMESAPSPQWRAPTPPRMGEFHYDRRQRVLVHQSAVPDLFASPQSQQTYTPAKQHHGLPAANQPSLYSRSGAYPQVPNTPGFNPSSQPRELFPAYTQLPPIGTGRPSLHQNESQSVPTRDLVSIVSRPIRTSETYTNHFAESSKSYNKETSHRRRRSSATGSNAIEMRSRWRPSTSARQPAPLISQTSARNSLRQGASVRNETSRKPSVSNRGNSQTEPQERRKPADNSSPRGIFKKRRDSLPRKAAAAARAAIARCSQNSKESKSEEVGQITPQATARSWAQVVAGKIKTELLEDASAVQVIPEQSSVIVKDEVLPPSNVQTWAQIAAAEWMGSKLKQELKRNASFGKPAYNFEESKIGYKNASIEVKVKEEAPRKLDNGPYDLPAMPKGMRLKKKTQTEHFVSDTSLFRRTVHA